MAKAPNVALFAFLLHVFNGAGASVCFNENPCLCEIDEHRKIDLSELTHNLQKGEFFEDEDANGRRFYFRGCTDDVFDPKKHLLPLNQTVSGSLIYLNNSGNSSLLQVLGKSNQIKFEKEKDDYEIVYKDDSNVNARIVLICSHYKDSFIKILSNDQLYLGLTSPLACVVTHSSGLGGFAVFLIILLVAFGIYFVGGCLLLYFVRGARGLEMIPNVDFWKSVPGKIKNGLIFLFSGCNPNMVTTSETYDRI